MQAGLREPRQRASLFQEQRAGFRIVRELGKKDLQRHRFTGADLDPVIKLGRRALLDQGTDPIALVQQKTGPDARPCHPRSVQEFFVARVQAASPRH